VAAAGLLAEGMSERKAAAETAAARAMLMALAASV
jgi:hypothetical protein